LWSSEEVWRGFSGYLSHRGWSCVAVRLRGRDGTEIADVRDHLGDLRAVISALPAAPAIIGHDLGGLLALHLSDLAAAVVALAPLVPPPVAASASRPSRGVLSRWLDRPLAPPRGELRDAQSASGGRIREAPSIVRQLSEREWMPQPSRVARLIAAGDRDTVSRADEVRRFATEVDAEFEQLTACGHAVLTQPGWEDRAARVHRWLIKRLGVELLALYEESQEQ
jgi:pimeloyl-ACP methyl ester carboxylesterase